MERLCELFGPRTGTWLFHRVRGEDTGDVSTGYKRKSLGHEESFARDIEADAELDRQLVRLAVRVAGDLRLKDLAGRTITVKLKDFDFTVRSASQTLTRPICTDRIILRTARKLLGQLRFKRRVKARLLGVTLSHIVPRGTPQMDLFASEASGEGIETHRDVALARSVDHISSRFGRKSIVRGVQVRSQRQPSN
jgi:DNA polymerase-4